MTAQINDTCFHKKINYNVSGISGSGLFNPADLGLKPHATNTACWRGYVAHYSIIDEKLLLTRLEISLAHQFVKIKDDGTVTQYSTAPKLFGVSPENQNTMHLSYRDIRHNIPFTGGLLLTDNFIPELYVHMGFHPPWKYKNVREIIFQNGRVTEDHDLSDQMAAAREKFHEESNPSGDYAGKLSVPKMRDWIAKCFSREY